ncbi:hypothetical protein [Effusibacillus consociatus]|uniref:Nucleotidyltransferase n=1 Tax=Effusibacillus consociatus TaxID=1117041 RepID=A0ABV9Q416_9BACL
MQHGNRIKVVRGIHIRVQKEYKNSMLFGGIYGSTAIGRDTEFSDIEMMYVLQPGTAERAKTFLYQGVPIEINFVPLDQAERRLEELTLQVPFFMGNLANLQLLVGDNKLRDDILTKYQQLPQEQIARFFLDHGSEIAYESFNKIRSIPRRANKRERELFVFEVIQEISLAIALLNRKPITRGYYTGVKETFEFENVPDNYKELVEVLLKATDVKDTIEAGHNLIDAYEKYLSEQGIRIRNVDTLDELDW